MFRILSLLVLLSISLSGYSQCFQKPVSLQERVLESEIVAEGRMDSSYCTWNSDHTLILTVSRFTVFKYFKGFSGNSVNVVTLGGVIDDQMMVAEPEVHLEKSAKGILFLKKNRTGAYEPVAAEQGFIEYDLITKSAAGPFDVYSNISSELYPLLVNLIGKNYTEVEPFNVNAKTLYRITATPTITSFSPTTVTSGTSTVLTINGTNFGASFSGSANIQFKNADNGGATYLASILASNIVSWSDVQIQVKVPYGAGSGQITVTNPTAESVVSAGTLTITYAQINVTSSNVQYEPNLINFNGLGGHTYLYSTATANNGVSFDGHANAKTRFASALGNWNCNTGFNVLVGAGNTAVGTPANDGVNVVMFDNDAAPLPSGVLGRATSWYSGCSGATNWFVSDIDIVFKRDGTDGTTWYFGSNAAAQPGGTSDFESVALHELGHNHQLGHVISLGAVMHYAITTGSNNRTLSPSKDIAGGLYVMGHSNTYTGCGKTGMTSFSCTNPPIANFSGTPTSFCNAPATANFTDLSTNAPTSWSWTFTGGTPATSTSQNPSGIVYNSTGSYTVSLTATNANGSNTMTKTAYITVGGTAVPLSETFEGAFLPTGYSIANADGFTTWQQTGSITGRS
ncbi:MAG: PKD domain-containing protein, partial [Cytophagaceae bacterium]